ncbi:MAG: TonB C-terminal domain-containing protein [Chitinispirillia bacterium]|nr:TonB C-terminal domain-containing protein [Chitinispirillia bacterium]
MADFSAPKYNRESCAADVRFRRVLFLSIGLHILVLVVIPLMTRLFWKEKAFERPATFQLVQAPQPKPPARTPPPPAPEQPRPPEPQPTPPPPPPPTPAPAPAPQPPRPKPEPRPVQPTPPEPAPQEPPPPPPPQEAVRPVEDNVDDLEAALFGTPAPPTQISAPGVPMNTVLQIYLNNVRVAVERNWQPPTQDRTLEVIVKFTINNDGSISSLAISKSSGNSTLDNVALRAVERVGRFPKFPVGISHDRLPIDFTLRPTTRR